MRRKHPKLRKVHRPIALPRTAVQVGGVWYRNHHEAAKALRKK